MDVSCSISLKEEDLPYEEDVLSNKYSVRSWLRYLDHKASFSLKGSILISL